jgi:hypothetical protein
MDATFLDLAHALRAESMIGLQATARLIGHVDAAAIVAMRERGVLVGAAAELLGQLAPHERVVRSMLEVGALRGYPSWSRNLSDLRAGDAVLMRGIVGDVFPTECQVAFAADRLATRFLIARHDLVAVEREPPTLWR